MINRYGIGARIQVIFHKLRHPRHKVTWRTIDESGFCPGDITCETCAVVFWCRLHDLSDEEINKRLSVL